MKHDTADWLTFSAILTIEIMKKKIGILHHLQTWEHVTKLLFESMKYLIYQHDLSKNE